jgi:uncharacterized membrane protein YraQ (UPF0718 family)
MMSSSWQQTLSMFVFLAFELSLLFLGISLLVGAIQRHVPQRKIAAYLSSERRRSYGFAALLGAITPFCSCSTIPMLKGLIRARSGFGPMMVFLLASPLLNPIIVGLLVATFGARLATTYVVVALLLAVAGGFLLYYFGFERTIRAEHLTVAEDEPICASGCSTGNEATETCVDRSTSKSAAPAKPTSRYAGLWRSVWQDFLKVLPYLLLGISVGSLIYGFMPDELLAQYTGADQPFAIPVAALVGIPLYIRAETVIPLAAALMGKGVGAGAVMALIIGSAGASLTELILLRSLFRWPLLVAFVAIILSMAVSAGYATMLWGGF